MERKMNEIGQSIDATRVVSITELKQNPAGVMRAAEHEAVAVLNHNKVVGYVISPAAYDGLMDMADDMHLLELSEERQHGKVVEVSFEDLLGKI
jgi:antitoxin StbD